MTEFLAWPEILTWLSWLALGAGAFFFAAGTVGLVRFPDIYCRLHAVTKADTLGLGLVVLGLALRGEGWQANAVMVLVWLLVMASGATAAQLLARHAGAPPGNSPAPLTEHRPEHRPENTQATIPDPEGNGNARR